MIRLWQPPDESRYLCSFGITEAIGAVIASAAVDVGVGAATASTIGSIGAGVVLGAAGGTVLSAATGGNIGMGALTGAITGGLIPAGGIIGGEVGGATGAAIGDVLGGAAGGALGAGITGGNPAMAALEGGAAGGVAAALAPSTGNTPVPGGAGSTAGGVISPTVQTELASAGVSDVAAGTPSVTAPTTALGTLAGSTLPVSPPDITAQVAGMPLVPDTGSLSTPGTFSEPATPTTSGDVALQQGAPLSGPISSSASELLSSAGNVPAAAPTAAPTATTGAPGIAYGPYGQVLGSQFTPTPQQAAATDPTFGGASKGGALDFLSKPSTLLAAAPLAMTLLRGESSLPPQYKQLQSQISGPFGAAARGQLNLANAGELTPGAAASVAQYVQQAQSALYQQLSASGVTNPLGDTRYIQGVGSIAQQASVITQGFVQQEFNNAFASAGIASNNLIAAANAQIAEDNAFTQALSSAMTSAGLLFAFSGGLKSA